MDHVQGKTLGTHNVLHFDRPNIQYKQQKNVGSASNITRLSKRRIQAYRKFGISSRLDQGDSATRQYNRGRFEGDGRLDLGTDSLWGNQLYSY